MPLRPPARAPFVHSACSQWQAADDSRVDEYAERDRALSPPTLQARVRIRIDAQPARTFNLIHILRPCGQLMIMIALTYCVRNWCVRGLQIAQPPANCSLSPVLGQYNAPKSPSSEWAICSIRFESMCSLALHHHGPHRRVWITD